MNQKEIAEEFLQLCAAGKARQAFEQFASPHFIHHNPWYEGHADALIIGMEDNHRSYPNKEFEIQRSVAEGDLVAVHSRVTMTGQPSDIAVVHILKFHGDKIVELWDIGQAAPTGSPNNLGMF
jgi:predicted SnoaL-like aldol condensation-catalyzing enzyme